MYKEAKPAQRLLAYIIDIIIMAIILVISYKIFSALSSHSYPKAEMDAMIDYVSENQITNISNYPGYNAVIESLSKWISAVILPMMLVYIVFIIGYFIVLPYFWGKQTVGRLITKVKMISQQTGQRPTVGQFAVREILVNSILMPVLLMFSYFIVIIIINIALLFVKRKTITDYLCKSTAYVMSNFCIDVEDYDNNDYDGNDYDGNDYDKYHDPDDTIDEDQSQNHNGFNDNGWN